MSRSDLSLTPVSYVVLGLVARDGPVTPYDLKAAVGRGIAHFWQFPHSQIYSESERLARLGLLVEEREDSGRRRRHYRVTAEGEKALAAWLAEPTSEVPQVRSLAILKLYFGHFADPQDIAALARAQQQAHLERQEFLGAMLERLQASDRPWQLAVGKLMRDAERAMANNWAQVERAAEDAEAADREPRGRRQATA
jgi:PadR family transcriptional regulator, regulatory protein AphA